MASYPMLKTENIPLPKTEVSVQINDRQFVKNIGTNMRHNYYTK